MNIHQPNIKNHQTIIKKNIKKTTLNKQRKNNQKFEPQEPVLVSEREARLRRRASSAIPPLAATRATTRHGVSVYLCLHSKRHWIPQRAARRSMSHAVDRSASSLAALARSLRSLDEKERERERERE